MDDDNYNLVKKFSAYYDVGSTVDFHNCMEYGVGLTKENANRYDPYPADTEYNYTLNRLYNKLYDGQPDLYTYNINGYSGNFFRIGEKVVNLEYNDCNLQGLPSQITTPDGLVYKFKAYDTAYMSGFNSTVGWKIDEIENINTKGKINFSYETFNYPFHKKYFESVESFTLIGEGSTHVVPPNDFSYNSLVRGGEATDPHLVGSFLKKIESSALIIDFISNSERLTTIKIYHKSDLNKPIKTIEFNYGYFGRDSNDDSRWLKLKSVVINGQGGNEKYEFDYVDEFYRDDEYLIKSGSSIDHWGYFNGSKSLSLEPECLRSIVEQYIGNNHLTHNLKFVSRKPAFEYTKKFALEKVIFPTGGYAKYQYELGGGYGIRVAQMEEFDGINPTKKYYKYTTPADIYVEPSYDWKSIEHKYPLIFGSSIRTFVDQKKYINFTTSPTLSTDDYNTICKFNEHVTEYLGNEQGLGGKIEYTFGLSPLNRPVLIKKEQYDSSNNLKKSEEFYHETKLLKTITYWTIPEIDETYVEIPANTFWNQDVPYAPPTDEIAPYLYLQYRFSSFGTGIKSAFWERLVKVVTVENDVTTTVDYIYRPSGYNEPLPLDCNPVEIKTTQSDNRVSRSVFKYPADFSSDPVLSEMKTRNMRNALIEKIDYINNIQLQSSKMTYQKWHSNIFAPLKLSTTRNNETWDDLIYHSYDTHGNPTCISKSDGRKTTYLWGYNYQYPIAVIENASYEDVKTSLGIDPELIASRLIPNNSDWNAIEALKVKPLMTNAHVTAYKYKSGIGIIESMNPSGFTAYYDYDSFGRLSILKDNQKNKIARYDYKYASEIPPVLPDIDLQTKIGYAKDKSVTFNATYEESLLSLKFDWYLKNASGQILQSKLSTTDDSFTAVLNQAGKMTLECRAYSNGQQKTVSRTFDVVAITQSLQTPTLKPTGSYQMDYCPIFGNQQPFGFEAVVSGGSGYYSYDWYIEGDDGIIFYELNNQSDKLFSYSLYSPGEYAIGCTIRDLITDEITGHSRMFKIKESIHVELTNISQSGNVVTATINASSPVRVKMQIGWGGATNDAADIRIAASTFSFRGIYEYRTVEVNLSQGANPVSVTFNNNCKDAEVLMNIANDQNLNYTCNTSYIDAYYPVNQFMTKKISKLNDLREQILNTKK